MSSRDRKHEHRESRRNPSRESLGTKRRRGAPRASASNRLDPVTGGPRRTSPTEGRKADGAFEAPTAIESVLSVSVPVSSASDGSAED